MYKNVIILYILLALYYCYCKIKFFYGGYAMEIEKLNFESSYLITELNCDQYLSRCNKLQIGGVTVYYDENVDIFKVNYQEKSIILIGYFFDIRESSKGKQEILIDLLKSKDFHNDLDYLNGRYNLIVFDGMKHYIYSDASQLRPLVYHQSSRSLCSHDSLLEAILINFNYNFTRRSEYTHTELDYTRYYEIFKFNPSLYLDYNEFEFIRLYPREELVEKNVEMTFEELKPYLDQSINYLENCNKDIFLTVTGGIDSRVSAALTRDISNRVEFLTYLKPKKKLTTQIAKIIYRNDEDITRDMKEYLGWNHSIINLGDYNISKEQDLINRKKYNSVHAFNLSNYYKEAKNYYKAIHVKSTVFGLGKADFSEKLDNHKDTYNFYKLCIHGLPNGFRKKSDFEKEINDYFERNKIYEGVTKGRHYFDLFHLESRMGNWHSMLTLETDPETEEFIFTNARKVIDLIQQPNIQDRREFKLYSKIVDYYWPVLSIFGINKPRDKRIKVIEDDSNRKKISYKEVDIIGINDIEITKQDNIIKAKPATEEIKNYHQYTFSIINHSSEKRVIKLSSSYNNQNAKRIIKVIMRESDGMKELDILDLNKEVEIEVLNDPIVISIYYKNSYKRPSWIDAGTLQIKIL